MPQSPSPNATSFYRLGQLEINCPPVANWRLATLLQCAQSPKHLLRCTQSIGFPHWHTQYLLPPLPTNLSLPDTKIILLLRDKWAKIQPHLVYSKQNVEFYCLQPSSLEACKKQILQHINTSVLTKKDMKTLLFVLGYIYNRHIHIRLLLL